MYRRINSTKRTPLEATSLDSLMDILTCSVGVMLFVVVFAVMEARGVSVKMFTPIVKDPPQNSERKIFICNKGVIRLFDIDHSVQKLFGNWKISYKNVPRIVNSANKKNITDGYFDYKLDYDEWTETDWLSNRTRHRSISLIVNERDGVTGETVDQLDEPSSGFLELIQQFDNEKVWIAFAVDSVSLELFRKAREIAVRHGFATGWDPDTIKFPHEEVVLGGGIRRRSKYAPNPELTKPQN
ncbi:MAG: hypothetical protein ACE5HI_07555 [bacterium]